MWKRISKKEIKGVAVGSRIRVDGQETILSFHYPHNDCGFKSTDDLKEVNCGNIFGSHRWENHVVEVWTPDPQTNVEKALEELVKALGDKYTVSVTINLK